MTGSDFSKQLNALVAQAFNEEVAFQHIVCQLETTKHMIVSDMVASQRQAALMSQVAKTSEVVIEGN